MPKKKQTRKKRPAKKEALAESEGLSDIPTQKPKRVRPKKKEAVPVMKPTVYVAPYKEIRYVGVAGVFRIRGPVTGIAYTFRARDRVSFVAIEDYEALLQRVRPARKCCGGKTIPTQAYFGPAG